MIEVYKWTYKEPKTGGRRWSLSHVVSPTVSSAVTVRTRKSPPRKYKYAKPSWSVKHVVDKYHVEWTIQTMELRGWTKHAHEQKAFTDWDDLYEHRYSFALQEYQANDIYHELVRGEGTQALNERDRLAYELFELGEQGAAEVRNEHYGKNWGSWG